MGVCLNARAPNPVTCALSAHEVIDALDCNRLHWVLDAIEWTVQSPLRLRNQLECVWVAIVICFSIILVLGIGELFELKRSDWVFVVLLVHVCFWRADVPVKRMGGDSKSATTWACMFKLTLSEIRKFASPR